MAATVRRRDSINAPKADAGDRLWVAELDVTDPGAVTRVVDEAFTRFGEIGVVVNSAGFGLLGAAEEATREQALRAIDFNLIGSIDVIRAALPHLRRQGRGRIVQVSSAGGQTTYPGFSYYHAAKWGIEGFCETVAKEVAPFGVTVTIAEPGATATNFANSTESAAPLPVYEDGPIGGLRRALADGEFNPSNNATAIARVVLDVGDRPLAPLCLTWGDDAYNDIHADCVQRLKNLEASRDIALSVARPTT